ncbi:MAG: kinase [Rhodospirillaceae bacterium]|nr:kinase [Rhodospirillaceae bacterium]
MRPFVTCFGATNVDIRARSHAPVIPGTSNPAERTISYGGVARNAALALTRLGCRTSLVGRVGKDAEGRAMRADLRQKNIETNYLGRSTSSPTATYTALLEPHGDMAVAFADTAIYDELRPRTVAKAARELSNAVCWFLDANVPETTLQSLADAKPRSALLAADAVSVAKSGRLAPILDQLDLLIANEDEAALLSGDGDARRAAMALVAKGVGVAVIGLGERGLIAAGRGLSGVVELDAPAVQVVDVTGAGDCLGAGVLFGLLTDRSTDAALRLGVAAAGQSLASPLAVPNGLNAERLLDRAGIAR